MKNTPRKIYLNVGDYPGDDFRELAEVTWCSDKQFEEDIAYVRLDLVERILQVVEERWGDEYPGGWRGIAGNLAKELSG